MTSVVSGAPSPWRTVAADAIVARLSALMIAGFPEVPVGHAVAVLRAEGLALAEARATVKFAVESSLVLLKARPAESPAVPALFVEINLANAHVQTAFIAERLNAYLADDHPAVTARTGRPPTAAARRRRSARRAAGAAVAALVGR